MPETRKRYLVVVLLLLAGVAVAWAQRLLFRSPAAAAPATPQGARSSTLQAGEPDFVYYVDVEGWYRITPYEAAVSSAYDLTGTTTADMAQALPPAIGDWNQAGSDEDLSQDPAVVDLLKSPPIALRRTYQDPSGQLLTLTLIGNRGEDSTQLFFHTPELCYPHFEWQVLTQRRESALLDDHPMSAQYMLARHTGTGAEQVVLYFYLWNDPQRDPKLGVLSVRVSLTIPLGESESAVRARGWDFIRGLFPATVLWDRF